MHWLQHSSLKSARAWRLKMALREVYARAAASNDPQLARADLSAWLSWARRCRLEPFKKLARTITERAEAVVRGMIDNRSNAFVAPGTSASLLVLNKRSVTQLLRAVAFQEIGHRQTSLKLNLVDCHRASPALLMRYLRA